jgi:thioredoxin reductase
VRVFEAADEPGGMTTQAIPDFRLPRSTVFQDIEKLKEGGMEIVTSSPVDGEVRKLLEQGFDAVFLAPGASAPKKISVPGLEGPGVYWGLDFLRDVKSGRPPELRSKVVVVGGGNVAVDTALAAARVGAVQVHMVCLEERDEMPAHPPEIEQALADGVQLHNGWGPAEIVRDGDRIRSVKFKKCTAVFDGSGRFNPGYDEETTMCLEAEAVILAIGQELAPPFAGSPLAAGARIQADPETCATPVEGVFAGGEGCRGPSSIIEALAEGRRAAQAIDKYLGGSGEMDEPPRPEPNPAVGPDEGFSSRARVRPPELEPSLRKGSFEQVIRSLAEEQARAEASRCLQCDLRLAISPVVLPPARETSWPLDEGNVAKVPAIAGVYRLYDSGGQVIQITGTPDLKEALQGELGKGHESVRFDYEESPMYTQRESELIQQYLQQHGRLPGGSADDLDDLF